MPIEVTLHCTEQSDVLEHLKHCKSLKQVIQNPKHKFENDDHYLLRVEEFAIQEDIYGNQTIFAPDDVQFWARFASINVLMPKDLEHPSPNYITTSGSNIDHTIGQWNTNFLAWLKSIAQQTRSRIKVSYMHERGDYLYETADWIFDFRPNVEDVEIFNLINWDGGMTPEWSGEISRNRAGDIKLSPDS
jgi:hypothetical protein